MDPSIPETKSASRANRSAPWLATLALCAACGGSSPSPPAITSLYLQVEEDGLVQGRILADREPGSITFSIVDAARNGALDLNPETGAFTYRPKPEYVGSDAFRVVASAAEGTSPPAEVQIDVLPVNDPPVVDPIAVAVVEDGVVSEAAVGRDADGDPLTFALSAPPAHGSAEVDAATGQLTYRPDRDWSGVDTFSIVASDGRSTSEPASVTITTTPVDDAPVAADVAIDVAEDGMALAVAPASDVDSPVVDFALATLPQHGSVMLEPASGAFVYRPDPDFAGTDTFTFVAGDGATVSTPATVTIAVTPVNDAPRALPLALHIDEDTFARARLLGQDAEGAALTFRIVEGPAHGAVALDPAGPFTYTPERDYAGLDVFSFVASDGQLESAAARVTVQVDEVNDAPLALGQVVTLAEDGVASGRLPASDVDSPALTFRVSILPAHGALDLNEATGDYSYVPARDFHGADAFTFVASDGTDSSAPAVVSLTVTAVDDAPAVAPAAASGSEDGVLTTAMTASDPDSAVVTFALATPPAHGAASIDPSSGVLTYRPDPDWSGVDTVTVTASDGQLSSAPATVSLTVAAVNDPPLATGGAMVLAEDGTLTGRLSASDLDSPSLTYRLFAPPTHGAMNLNEATGEFWYAPARDFYGTDTFTYVASDGTGTSAPAAVSLAVTAVNDAPTVAPAAASGTEDGVLSVTMTASDPDSTVLAFALATPPAHGTASVDPSSGLLTYRPDPDWNGVDTLAVTASDGQLASVPATVSLTVAAVNDAPVAEGRAVVLEEDGLASGRLTASDVDGPVLVFSIGARPAHGTLELDQGTGAYSYVPARDFNGADAFTFVASDGIETSAPATVTVTVTAVNDAPVVLATAATGSEDGTLTAVVTATDADGEPLAFAISSPPAHGTASMDAATGAVTYRPEPDWNGSDAVSVVASDGRLTSAPAILSLTVTAVNDAPVAESSSTQLEEDALGAGRVTAHDVDGPVVVFAVREYPAHGQLDLNAATGDYSYAPAQDFNGSDSFTFVASDGIEPSAPATVSLTVTPVNDAPVVATATATGPEDSVLTVTVRASDPEGDPTTFAVAIPPAHGTAAIDPSTGVLTYSPDANWNGSDSVSLSASDGSASSAAVRCALEVTPVNDPPVARDGRLTSLEDEVATGQLAATDVEGQALTFALGTAPAHGSVTIDGATGAYSYAPQPDFNGADAFTFTASDGSAVSAPARIDVDVAPQNDAPVLPALPDVVHEPGAPAESIVVLAARDQDGDPLSYRVLLSRPGAVSARVLPTAQLGLTPIASGVTVVTVTASDGLSESSSSFTFTANEGIDTATLTSDDPHGRAIVIRNTSDADLDLVLRHGDSVLATSPRQLIDEALALPDAPGETGLAPKLWRLTRDETYHFDPLVAAVWQHDPILMFNSIGFGLCDDAAAVYTTLARAAGEQARTWFLDGHIVPEIWVNSRWRAYDPDLGVYYEGMDGEVAGVEELANDSSLITSPRRRVSPTDHPYSEDVASVYSTQTNNMLEPEQFYAPLRTREPVRLARRAQVAYPGIWADLPVGIWGTEIEGTAQLKLDLPPGFVGTIDWPLVLWDVQGRGIVRIGPNEFQAGSPELKTVLRNLEHGHPVPRGLNIVSSESMSLVFLLNPLRFRSEPAVTLELASTRPADLYVESTPLAQENRLPLPTMEAVARPR